MEVVRDRPDAILAARVLLLRASLVNVQTVLETVSRIRTEREQNTPVEAVDAALDQLTDAVDQIQQRLKQSHASAFYAVNDLLMQIEQAAFAVGKELHPPDQELHRSRMFISMQTLEKGPHEFLKDSAAGQLTKLNTIDQKLQQANRANKQGKTDRAKELWSTCWSDAAAVSDESRAIFAEYVDFLGGLAIRDIGLDNGICRLADALVREWVSTRWAWSSMTVPALQEVGDLTLAQFIRLGFPEWSVWALPLAAHQFAAVALATQPLRGILERDGTPGRSAVLADAFATYIMGPAYACAALLLRLDPLGANAEVRAIHARRAEAIHQTLAVLDNLDGTRPLAGLRARLRTQWDVALEQVGGETRLTNADREAIRRDVQQLADAIGTPKALPTIKWGVIAEWSKHLQDGTQSQIEPSQEDNDEIRFVLNAAWVARLDSDPSTFANIETRAIELAERIIEPEVDSEAVRKKNERLLRAGETHNGGSKE